MDRFCTIIHGGVGRDENAADDGAYDLLDVSGTPEEVGRAIAESLKATDLWNAQGGGAIEDRGRPVFLNLTIRIERAAGSADQPTIVKE